MMIHVRFFQALSVGSQCHFETTKQSETSVEDIHKIKKKIV